MGQQSSKSRPRSKSLGATPSKRRSTSSTSSSTSGRSPRASITAGADRSPSAARMRSRVQSFAGLGFETGPLASSGNDPESSVVLRRRPRKDARSSSAQWQENTGFVADEDREVFPERPLSMAIFDQTPIIEVDEDPADAAGAMAQDEDVLSDDADLGYDVEGGDKDTDSPAAVPPPPPAILQLPDMEWLDSLHCTISGIAFGESTTDIGDEDETHNPADVDPLQVAMLDVEHIFKKEGLGAEVDNRNEMLFSDFDSILSASEISTKPGEDGAPAKPAESGYSSLRSRSSMVQA
eukprot:m.33141 g.33141  ORF g.33141 m.33141 type:complete len:294 (-) comp5595_c0_seq2:225-1106(-)